MDTLETEIIIFWVVLELPVGGTHFVYLEYHAIGSALCTLRESTCFGAKLLRPAVV
jgi:hypothetical protein